MFVVELLGWSSGAGRGRLRGALGLEPLKRGSSVGHVLPLLVLSQVSRGLFFLASVPQAGKAGVGRSQTPSLLRENPYSSDMSPVY